MWREQELWSKGVSKRVREQEIWKMWRCGESDRCGEQEMHRVGESERCGESKRCGGERVREKCRERGKVEVWKETVVIPEWRLIVIIATTTD